MAASNIKWSAVSIKQFTTAIDYISRDSPQNAELVEVKILVKIEKAATLPKSNPPDKYKFDNDGSYRAFSIAHYRVSYRVKKGHIEILRIRHTSMEPKFY